ncbi:MAG TPA: allophanate hydrolase [Beijerinckiaceae bacterium]|nr:allophanate hydrolase [Beijerinckiaceae bacterium]
MNLDLVRLRRAYAHGETRPSEVVRAILSRISSRGEDGVWLSLFSSERLLERAGALERLGKPERARTPLWGVPFAVKDNIAVAGLPTTAGCPAFSYLPVKSATAVARLVAAGAIPIGKTNLDQFATGLVGTRTPGKAPLNPFDPAYVCGGSSSGSAVAVATGLASFALGTDTAGSGRVPAGFCNLVGLKPTRGRVSAAGLVPACRSLDCVSIFALTVEDALAILAVAEGLDQDDPYSRPTPLNSERPIGERFRFATPDRRTRAEFGDPASETGFLSAIESLQRLGGTPVELDFAPFAEAAALLYGSFVAERTCDLGNFVATHSDSILPVTKDIICGGASASGVDVFRAQHRLAALCAPLRQVWAEVDCLVVPTYPRPVSLAEIHADPLAPNALLGVYTNFVNPMDLAAIAVPAGFRDDGLPHGVTLIGPAFSDFGLAGLASRFHRAVGKRLGATAAALPELSPRSHEDDCLPLAVFGAHLSGQALNGQLVALDARLSGPCRTAPCYRLFALPDGRPGLLRSQVGGAVIEGEIWRLPAAALGPFMASISAPLGIGRVTLRDGTETLGFLCEASGTIDALEITQFGDWRAWRASLR